MRLFSLLLFLLAATPAFASGMSAVYTSYDLKNCEEDSPPAPESNPDYGGSKICDGFKADPQYQIIISSDEGSEYVAFGPHGELACSGISSFGYANNKIEWRLRDNKPIATIQRWQSGGKSIGGGKLKNWLVVTKLEKTNSCHMAYVEAGLPDANLKAPQLVDDTADHYTCLTDKTVILSASDTDLKDLPSMTCEQFIKLLSPNP